MAISCIGSPGVTLSIAPVTSIKNDRCRGKYSEKDIQGAFRKVRLLIYKIIGDYYIRG